MSRLARMGLGVPIRFARAFRNAVTDLRFGGLCGGTVWNAIPGATNVVSTDYSLMPQIFSGEIQPSDVLVDLGCGKGRILNYWLRMKYGNKIVGIELNGAVADWTRRRLVKHPNVQVVTGSVFNCLPIDGTLFYMFNPFDDLQVACRFSDRLVELFGGRRPFKLLYYACVHLSAFQRDRTWQVEERIIKLPRYGRYLARHCRLAAITFRDRKDVEQVRTKG